MLTDKDYKWMAWCMEGAKIFSTCEKKQYMAIIVDKNGIVESTGYNGSPSGFPHCFETRPRFINRVPSGTPYDFGEGLCYSIHSEINCLIHSDKSKRVGGTMYLNGVPCFGCAKAIANSGLERLVYLEEGFERVGNDEAFKVLSQSKLSIEGLVFP